MKDTINTLTHGQALYAATKYLVGVSAVEPTESAAFWKIKIGRKRTRGAVQLCDSSVFVAWSSATLNIRKSELPTLWHSVNVVEYDAFDKTGLREESWSNVHGSFCYHFNAETGEAMSLLRYTNERGYEYFVNGGDLTDDEILQFTAETERALRASGINPDFVTCGTCGDCGQVVYA